jgi:abortive infection bacteriophage resistance protein
MSIGNAVFREHFEIIVSRTLQTTLGGAYGWCAYTCLHSVKSYCDRYNYNQPSHSSLRKALLDRVKLRRYLIQFIRMNNRGSISAWVVFHLPAKTFDNCKQLISSRMI